ncbi:MAG TPA: glycosyltransferase family 4 protein [Acidimicrobiia bacterium]|nr:glycosyltransferase family 4 protein [Acidimicrobiia bacterium]
MTTRAPRRILQLAARYEPGDAVSDHVRALRDWFALRADTAVFVERHDARTSTDAEPIAAFDGGPDDLVVLHASVGGPLLDAFGGAPGRKALVFHNFTPAHFFAEWDPPTARLLERSWTQLRLLAPLVEVACGVSAFNARLLAALGFAAPSVLPLVVDLDLAGSDPVTDERLAADRRGGGARWLCVGRVSPNKAQHEVVLALAVSRRSHDPDARLWLVGSDFTPSYTAAVRELAATLGVTDAIDITGPVPDAALRSYYRAADVFVSCSEHEGFGVPLVEAMAAGVPVVALGAAAVAETVADAALVLDRNDPYATALAVASVLGDVTVRTELVRRGRTRAATFTRDALDVRLGERFGRLLAAPPPPGG